MSLCLRMTARSIRRCAESSEGNEEIGGTKGVPYGAATVTSFRPHPNGTAWALGGNAKDNAFANADSWPKVLEFLSKSLK